MDPKSIYRRLIAIGSFSLLMIGLLAWLLPQSAAAEPSGGTVGTGTPGSCTEAALNAKLTGGGTVTFSCGANPYTFTLTSGRAITANTTLDGGGKITLSGGDTVKVFSVNAGFRLTLNNLTIAHGNSALGGCVLVQGALNATQSTFRNCTSHTAFIFAGSGGAIAGLNGTIALTDSFILNNSVELNGGGLFVIGGQTTLNHVSILSNTAYMTYTDSGGGVYVTTDSNFIALNSSFLNNYIGYTGQGGGLYVYSSTALLINTSANYNVAQNAADGGGIYAENSQFTMQGGSANGNRGLYDGGGLSLQNSVSNISNATIKGNIASSNGGGLNTYLGSLSLNNVLVTNNLVDSDGAGLDLYSTPTSLVNVTINNNVGGRDGAGINNYRSTLTLDRVTMSGNVNNGSGVGGGQGDGGAIYNDSSALIATNSTIDHNTSTGTAGGIYNASGSTVDLTNVTLSGNTAGTNGGSLYNDTSFSTDVTAITLTNVTIKDNQAGSGGTFNGAAANNIIRLKNTVLADNTPGNCAGQAFNSAKYSLSTDSSCTLSGTGNHTHLAAQLFPLSNNGGATKTHLPAPGSPLVNAINGIDFPSTDQRGIARPQGLHSDIGTVERQPSDPLISPWLYLPLLLR